MRILIPALLLASCSPPAAQPANDAKPAEAVAAATVAPTPAPETDSHAVPRPGTLKTFGDWIAGCDNTRTCTLASLGPDGGDFPAVTVAVTRAGGPEGAIAVSLDAEQDTPAPVTATIDGTAFDAKAAAPAFAAAMVNGHELTLRDAKGGTTVQSLKGASAGLRYIDAMQGRAGTVTALVAKGPKPAAAVPPAPAMPVILATALDGAGAAPTAAQLATMRQRAKCEPPVFSGPDTLDPQSYRLDGGASLVLVPCSVGAYNVSAALFVVRDGKIVPAQVDAPSGFDATGAEGEAVSSVVNGEAAKGLLTSYAKGRGLGDCGDTQSFAWDGTRLRLAAQSDMGECRGNPNYIPIWRAKVVRR